MLEEPSITYKNMQAWVGHGPIVPDDHRRMRWPRAVLLEGLETSRFKRADAGQHKALPDLLGYIATARRSPSGCLAAGGDLNEYDYALLYWSPLRGESIFCLGSPNFRPD